MALRTPKGAIMRRKILVAAAIMAVATTVFAGIATAGSHKNQQRIAIVLDDASSTFTLTPLRAGPVKSDTGTYSACCWTRKFRIRDGQSIEIDNPKLTFTGKSGTFSWRAQLTFVDLDNGYTVATSTWKITRGTGVYAHLEGHGRQAFIEKTSETNQPRLADKAEGLVDLHKKGSTS
jgi:hypothetical protein